MCFSAIPLKTVSFCLLVLSVGTYVKCGFASRSYYPMQRGLENSFATREPTVGENLTQHNVTLKLDSAANVGTTAGVIKQGTEDTVSFDQEENSETDITNYRIAGGVAGVVATSVWVLCFVLKCRRKPLKGCNGIGVPARQPSALNSFSSPVTYNVTHATEKTLPIENFDVVVSINPLLKSRSFCSSTDDAVKPSGGLPCWNNHVLDIPVPFNVSVPIMTPPLSQNLSLRDKEEENSSVLSSCEFVV